MTSTGDDISEGARRSLEAAAGQVASVPPDDIDAAVSAFQTLRIAVFRATLSSSDALAEVEPKIPILQLLVFVHTAKKLYRRQVASVAQALLQIQEWHDVAMAESMLEPVSRLLDSLDPKSHKPGRPASIDTDKGEPATDRLPCVPDSLPVPPIAASPKADSSPRARLEADPIPSVPERTISGRVAIKGLSPEERLAAARAPDAPQRTFTKEFQPPARVEDSNANKWPARASDDGSPPVWPARLATDASPSDASPKVADDMSPRFGLDSLASLGFGQDSPRAAIKAEALLQQGVQQMAAMDFSVPSSRGIDAEVSAFEAFRRAVVHLENGTRNSTAPNCTVLDEVESKAPILRFLVAFYNRKRAHRKRVNVLLASLLKYESWRAAVESDLELQGTLASLGEDTTVAAADNIKKNVELREACTAAVARGAVGALWVRIIAAYDLINADWFSLSDPYVKVTVGSRTERTHIIDDNLNPRWECEPWVFDVPRHSALVCFEVLDKDRLHPSHYRDRKSVV